MIGEEKSLGAAEKSASSDGKSPVEGRKLAHLRGQGPRAGGRLARSGGTLSRADLTMGRLGSSGILRDACLLVSRLLSISLSRRSGL